MARFEFKLPDIGEGVAEGEVVSWSVKAGDVVVEDQPMVEVMTDKATVTIGAPKAGRIAELLAPVGGVVKVGALLVVIDTAGGAAAASASPTAAAPAPAAPAAASPAAASPAAASPAAGAKKSEPAATAVGDIKDSLPGSAFFASKPAAAKSGNGQSGLALHAAAAEGVAEYFAEKPLATPATRKLARDLAVDLRRVPPTGASGRVTKEDVRGFGSKTQPGTTPTPLHADVATSSGTQLAQPSRAAVSIKAPSAESSALEERKPFVGIRRRIAERMQTSVNTAAHFTFVEECDVGALKALHARLRPHAEAQGVKLTLLPFIAKAVVTALKKHPTLNCALDESTNELVYRKYYDLGIAAATDQGLMVPVVRHADRRGLLDLAREIDRLGTGARAGTLKSDELSGSTFTITSLGKQGGLFATPVLNFPEVGILGVHQIKQKPVVRDGEIVVGEVMLLSLSFDHRIVDGHVGAAFAYEIIGYLQNPDLLLLEG